MFVNLVFFTVRFGRRESPLTSQIRENILEKGDLADYIRFSLKFASFFPNFMVLSLVVLKILLFLYQNCMFFGNFLWFGHVTKLNSI